MSNNEQKLIFSKNLNYLLEVKKITQKEVADSLKIKPSTFNSWCTGTKMPRMDKMQKLADYFGVTKSDLIEDLSIKTNKHSVKYTQSTNLCKMYFNGVMSWSEDRFLCEYETIVIREHISDLLLRYKKTLEVLTNSKMYWKREKEKLIKFYRERNPELTEKDIKELFIKQEIELELEDMINWINAMPGWIARKEEWYENNEMKQIDCKLATLKEEVSCLEQEKEKYKKEVLSKDENNEMKEIDCKLAVLKENLFLLEQEKEAYK